MIHQNVWNLDGSYIPLGGLVHREPSALHIIKFYHIMETMTSSNSCRTLSLKDSHHLNAVDNSCGEIYERQSSVTWSALIPHIITQIA
jgi:hypothetical protein